MIRNFFLHPYPCLKFWAYFSIEADSHWISIFLFHLDFRFLTYFIGEINPLWFLDWFSFINWSNSKIFLNFHVTSRWKHFHYYDENMTLWSLYFSDKINSDQSQFSIRFGLTILIQWTETKIDKLGQWPIYSFCYIYLNTISYTSFRLYTFVETTWKTLSNYNVLIVQFDSKLGMQLKQNFLFQILTRKIIKKNNYIILHEHLSSSQTYQQYNASFYNFKHLVFSDSAYNMQCISFHICIKNVCTFMKSAFFPFYSDSFSSLLIKQIVSCIKYHTFNV